MCLILLHECRTVSTLSKRYVLRLTGINTVCLGVFDRIHDKCVRLRPIIYYFTPEISNTDYRELENISQIIIKYASLTSTVYRLCKHLNIIICSVKKVPVETSNIVKKCITKTCLYNFDPL